MTSTNANKLVREFEEAAVAKSWIGSREPSEYKYILDEYKIARTALVQALKKCPADHIRRRNRAVQPQ